MSEIQTAEDVHRFLAELDRTQPVGDPHELREREYQRRKERDQRERERQAREARKAEEKRQAVASTDWYAAVDTRIRTHFKDWAWAAIDERIHEHLEIAQKPLVESERSLRHSSSGWRRTIRRR